MVELFDRKTKQVFGESVLFRDGREGKLLFVPSSISRVYLPSTGEELVAGRDFVWKEGSKTLIRPAGSRIQEMDWLSRPVDDPEVRLFPAEDANAIGGGANNTALRFAPSTYFADIRVEVDYIAEEIDLEEPVFTGLPKRFMAKLAAGEKVKICAVGDSITDGWNATEKYNAAPFGKPYIRLVLESLNERYKDQVTLCNYAISGTGCGGAKDIREKWLPDCSDLLLIAYGMNDFGGTPSLTYGKEICGIMDLAKEQNPDVEFILVASMPKNVLWYPDGRHPHNEFAGVLYGIAAAREDTCVADVNRFWSAILARKDYYDLAGNGVNHPNDYGHRIYATAVNKCFDTAAAEK